MRFCAKGCRLYSFLLLFIVLTCGNAEAQDKQWFGSHKRGNRYEGLVDRPNGLAEYKILDLIGITGEPSLANASNLHILYYVPDGDTISAFRVEERVDETHYFMEPVDKSTRPHQWNLFEPWPTSDVITPNQVHPDNLGVLIHLKDARVTDLIAPAFLYAGTQPGTFSRYTLHLFVYRPLRSLTCTVRDTNGSQTSSNNRGYTCNLAGRKPPTFDSPTTSSSMLRFDILSSDLPPGLVTVHLSGQYANAVGGERFNNDIHFYHQPPPIVIR